MNQVEKYCNMCGKKIKSKSGILREDCLIIEKRWGYFSEKDGEIHRICLCEKCYDRWSKSLMVPPLVTQETELLS